MPKIKEEIDVEELDEKLKEKLKEDPEFRKYKAIVKHIEKTYDLDDIQAEARRLHEGRKSRMLPKAPSGDAVIEAMLQDGSNRSRLARLLVDMTNQDGILEEANKSIQIHIQVRYELYLPSLRTKGDRSAYLNQYIRRGVRLKHRINVLMKVLDIYVTDIDKMGYTFSNTVELLKKIYDKAGSH